MKYVALIAEDTDIFDGRIVLPDSKYLCFVGGECDWSTEGGNCYEHILVTESVESLPKGVLGETVYFELEFAVVKLYPIVVHKIFANKYQSHFLIIIPTLRVLKIGALRRYTKIWTEKVGRVIYKYGEGSLWYNIIVESDMGN